MSLDDFGIGQTSLGYLSSLPVHELKIDKSFVMDMMANPAHAAIVRSIVDLGHNLSLRVVAEGVETDDVFATLRDAGCDLAQGYLLARPMPVDRLRWWLSSAAPAHARDARLTGRGVPSWGGGRPRMPRPPRRCCVPLPWGGQLAGRIEEHVSPRPRCDGNPLGDPVERPLWVYVPPGYDDERRPLPSIYVIQGYTGYLTMWANRERLPPALPRDRRRTVRLGPGASVHRGVGGRLDRVRRVAVRGLARDRALPLLSVRRRGRLSSTRATGRSTHLRTGASRGSRAGASGP